MTPKRKKAEEKILAVMKRVDPTGKNSERYQDMFSKMSDAQFHEWMCAIRDKQAVIAFYYANLKDKTTVDHLRTICQEMGIKLFERLRLWDEPTQTWYLTPQEYCILQLPLRRMSQFVDHKMSVPEGDMKLDALSGMPLKPYRAAGISQVEVQALYAKNLKETIRELISVRGGDVVSMADFIRELEETGRSSGVKSANSMPRSAVVLDELLAGCLIESNFAGVNSQE